jgi:hypothetical protein
MNKNAPTFSKSAGEALDYKIDMSPELTDSLSSVTWALPEAGADPRDLVKIDSSFDAKSATIWLKGGFPNKTYRVIATLHTAGGRVYERYFRLTVTS